LKVLTADEIPLTDATFAFATSARRWFDYELSLKRILDILVAGFTLVGTLPICLAVVIAIKLDSPGPAIFTQQRVGRHGRRFRFLKFRSMYIDAEQRLSELQVHNETDGPVFKMRKDPRITRVGAILRRTSLDELPQVINVLRGEMSVVGPRPPLVGEVEHYRPQDMVRLSVKPGITCLWQIRGRSAVSFDTWMEYDREYIRGMSLLLDLSILVRTVWAVLSCKGAY
jgi:exopolysaccharide biosynthesis polyprenyl glycosylphosphotransferase